MLCMPLPGTVDPIIVYNVPDVLAATIVLQQEQAKNIFEFEKIIPVETQ